MIKAFLLIALGVILAALVLPGLLRTSKTVKETEIPEALGILGLNDNPSKEQIVRAHRTKMRIHHPDLGGSQFLAAKVNWAKDVLMKSAPNVVILTLANF